MPTVTEAIERLKRNGKQHVAVAIWCEDDVLGRAGELGFELNSQDAAEILDTIDRKQDCSIGINWDVLDFHIQDYAHKHGGDKWELTPLGKQLQDELRHSETQPGKD